jgi:hypothetical protein
MPGYAAMKKKRLSLWVETASLLFLRFNYFPNLIDAWAADSLAIGTLNGEQLT